MAATWKILNCDRTVSLGGEEDVITKVHFHVSDTETVSDVVHSGQRQDQVDINTDDLSDFTAYASVSEANIIAWVKASLGAEEVSAIEATVANQIALSKGSGTATGVPWG